MAHVMNELASELARFGSTKVARGGRGIVSSRSPIPLFSRGGSGVRGAWGALVVLGTWVVLWAGFLAAVW